MPYQEELLRLKALLHEKVFELSSMLHDFASWNAAAAAATEAPGGRRLGQSKRPAALEALSRHVFSSRPGAVVPDPLHPRLSTSGDAAEVLAACVRLQLSLLRRHVMGASEAASSVENSTRDERRRQQQQQQQQQCDEAVDCDCDTLRRHLYDRSVDRQKDKACVERLLREHVRSGRPAATFNAELHLARVQMALQEDLAHLSPQVLLRSVLDSLTMPPWVATLSLAREHAAHQTLAARQEIHLRRGRRRSVEPSPILHAQASEMYARLRMVYGAEAKQMAALERGARAGAGREACAPRLSPRLPALLEVLEAQEAAAGNEGGAGGGKGGGAAPGCPWCAAEEEEEEEAEAKRQRGRGGSRGSAQGEGQPVPFESPFMWRRLWWALLDRLDPERRAAAVEKGHCPHACSPAVWKWVVNRAWLALLEDLGWTMGVRLAGGISEEAIEDVPEPLEAELAYARALNAAFEEAYSPCRVVLACRVIEALGPMEFTWLPSPESVLLWPAMAGPAVSHALMRSRGAEGWGLHFQQDEAEGGQPMYAAWYHMRMLGMAPGGGGDSSAGGSAAERRRILAAEDLQRLLQGCVDGHERRLVLSRAVRRMYGNPDLRYDAVLFAVAQAFLPSDFEQLQRQGNYDKLLTPPWQWRLQQRGDRCDRCGKAPSGVKGALMLCPGCGLARYCGEGCRQLAMASSLVTVAGKRYGHSACCGYLTRQASCFRLRLFGSGLPCLGGNVRKGSWSSGAELMPGHVRQQPEVVLGEWPASPVPPADGSVANPKDQRLDA